MKLIPLRRLGELGGREIQDVRDIVEGMEKLVVPWKVFRINIYTNGEYNEKKENEFRYSSPIEKDRIPASWTHGKKFRSLTANLDKTPSNLYVISIVRAYLFSFPTSSSLPDAPLRSD